MTERRLNIEVYANTLTTGECLSDDKVIHSARRGPTNIVWLTQMQTGHITSSTRTMSFMCWSDSRSNLPDLRTANAHNVLQDRPKSSAFLKYTTPIPKVLDKYNSYY